MAAPLTNAKLKEELLSEAHHAYDQREVALGEEVMREVERRVMLSVLDRTWREHLYEMDYLQEGIGLRAMAQRDPLVEYQREGFALWTTMNEAVREESVGLLFHVDVQVDQPTEAPTVEPVHVSQMLGAMAGAPAAMAEGSDGDAVQSHAEDKREPEPDSRSPALWPAGSSSVSGSTACPGPRNVEKCPASAWAARAPAPLHYTAPSETGGVDERDEKAPAAIRLASPTSSWRTPPEERAVPLRVRQEVQDVPRPALTRTPTETAGCVTPIG